jgi:hypothetical protein
VGFLSSSRRARSDRLTYFGGERKFEASGQLDIRRACANEREIRRGYIPVQAGREYRGESPARSHKLLADGDLWGVFESSLLHDDHAARWSMKTSKPGNLLTRRDKVFSGRKPIDVPRGTSLSLDQRGSTWNIDTTHQRPHLNHFQLLLDLEERV